MILFGLRCCVSCCADRHFAAPVSGRTLSPPLRTRSRGRTHPLLARGRDSSVCFELSKNPSQKVDVAHAPNILFACTVFASAEISSAATPGFPLPPNAWSFTRSGRATRASTPVSSVRYCVPRPDVHSRIDRMRLKGTHDQPSSNASSRSAFTTAAVTAVPPLRPGLVMNGT